MSEKDPSNKTRCPDDGCSFPNGSVGLKPTTCRCNWCNLKFDKDQGVEVNEIANGNCVTKGNDMFSNNSTFLEKGNHMKKPPYIQTRKRHHGKIDHFYIPPKKKMEKLPPRLQRAYQERQPNMKENQVMKHNQTTPQHHVI